LPLAVVVELRAAPVEPDPLAAPDVLDEPP